MDASGPIVSGKISAWNASDYMGKNIINKCEVFVDVFCTFLGTLNEMGSTNPG
jgi:hypothetical protein